MKKKQEKESISRPIALRKSLKMLARIVLILLLIMLITIVSGVAFIEIRVHQTITLPTPTGSYAVGRTEYDWTDQSRIDTLAPHAGTKRELVVWAWYPAAHQEHGPRAPYLPQKWGQLNDQEHNFLELPFIQKSNSIQTNSIEPAPLATLAERYPMLIFEPGMGNIPTQYTTLLEDLASHGYIIFAIAPTYSANVVVFPDGRVAEKTPAGSPNTDNDANLQVAGDRIVQVWAKDVSFVMGQLAALNTKAGSMFRGHLDLTRLGVFGHSFGGATAAQICHLDARCKAGIDLDGVLFGDVVRTGLDKPFMVIQHDMGACSDSDCRSFQREIQSTLRAVPRGASYNLSIKDTEHFNFSDYAAYFSPLQLLGLLGSIDGVRGLQITHAYVRAFFDTYLNGIPSSLLRGPSSSYPEVQFLTP
jgi:hypothetical protein